VAVWHARSLTAPLAPLLFLHALAVSLDTRSVTVCVNCAISPTAPSVVVSTIARTAAIILYTPMSVLPVTPATLSIVLLAQLTVSVKLATKQVYFPAASVNALLAT
jgi:hypothetical protein